MQYKKSYYTLSIILLLFAGLTAKAQVRITAGGTFEDNNQLKDPQPIVGKIYYDLYRITDTITPDTTHDLLVVAFTQKTADCSSELFRRFDSSMQEQIKQQSALLTGTKTGSVTQLFSGKDKETGSNEHLFIDLTANKVYEIKNLINKNYLIADTGQTINWEIQDSTKTIGNYTAQKATGTSHGRDYTAWFTTDLPYSFGPRRLYGLPGLILEASDATRQVSFRFHKIELGNSENKSIGLPETAVAATPSEFKELEEAFARDPQSFIMNQIKASLPPGTKLKVVTSEGSTGFKPQAKAKNPRTAIPIDLD